MPAGQQIAFEPTLALMLAQHLHHPPVRREMIVVGFGLGHPGAIGDLERVLPAVGVVLVRTEQAEVARLHVQLHHIAQEPAHHASRFGRDGARRGHLDRVVAEIRQPQIAQQQAAIGVRVGAHAAGALAGRARRSSGRSRPLSSNSSVRPVALHPFFEDAHMRRVLVHLAHRHLMRAPVAFGALAVDLLRARSSPWACAARSSASSGRFGEAVLARVGLDALDLADDACRACRPSARASLPDRRPRRNSGV